MDRLAAIIADIIKSAVSWEQEHGAPEHVIRKIEPQNPLTVLDITDTLNTIDNLVKGGHDDDQDKIQKSEQG